MPQLITEQTDNIQYIVETSEHGPAQYFVEGIVMQGNIKNRNGRIYPKAVLEREVHRYVKEKVNDNRAYGELNHPSGPTINLDRVSHLFTELREDGDNIVGRAKVIDTPMGKIVKSLIDEGANLGISSRGMGSLKKNENGIMEVQDDFHLATAGDIVADPSAPQAFVRGVMEGVEWVYDIASGTWQAAEAFDRIEEEIKKTARRSSKELEEQTSQLFERFLRSL